MHEVPLQSISPALQSLGQGGSLKRFALTDSASDTATNPWREVGKGSRPHGGEHHQVERSGLYIQAAA